MTTGTGNLGEASLSLVADSKQLKKDLKKVRKDTVKELAGIGKALTKTLTPAIGALAAGVFAATESIDEGLATIRTGTGATGEAMEGLRDDFEAVLGTVPADVQTVAGAIADLNTTLGLTGKELQDAARNAIEMADAMGINASEAIDKTARAMKAFGEEGRDPVDVMNRMFVVAQKTNIPIDSLTQTLSRYGQNLAAAGFEMDQAIALLGAMHENGLPARTTMSGLSTALDRMANEGITDMNQGLRDLIQGLIDAEQPADALATASDYFGITAGPALAQAARSGALDIDALVVAMNDSEGAIMANAEATRTHTERFKALRQEVTERVAGAFNALPAPLQVAGAALGGTAAAAGPLLVALPGLVTAAKALSLANLKSVASSTAATAATAVRTVATVAATVATSAGAVATTAFGVALRIALGPIGLIITAIGLLVAAAILIWKNWDEIKAKTIEIWNSIKQFLRQAWDNIKAFLRRTWNTIVGFFRENWDIILAILFPAVGLPLLIARNWGKIKKVVSELLAAVFARFGAFWTSLKQWFEVASLARLLSRHWSKIKGVIADLWKFVLGIFKEHWDKILAVIFPPFGLSLLVAKHWGAIADTVKGIWQKAVGYVKDAVNSIIGFINALIRAWNNISFKVPKINIPKVTIGGGTLAGVKLPSATIGGGTFGGQTFNTPNMATIPRLAEGGIAYDPTLALIGEEEPEAVAPLGDLLAMAGRGGGGGGMTVIVEGNIMDGEDFWDRVAEGLREVRRGGGGDDPFD